MRTVYKYPVPRRSTKFDIILKKDFKFLRIHFQGDDLQLWTEVETTSADIRTFFQLLGTGHEVPQGATYLQTYDDGPFVMHLYKLA